ncbi:hypothetical protein [Metabacillus rhizolycopersici]|uniref:Uncharacterized protein n=1 Tax=Metabacillus rhizolycopersici TaxID=2875709 RepID=A0ABS7UX73_9BACI|nr:hypothetical protein [Metabacillus rhizolycopersici]MBZ5752530.1 hypothetical protein [Metabacillus rhizolycopersici]
MATIDNKVFEERMRKLKNSYEQIPTVSSTEKIMEVVKQNEKPTKKRMSFQLPYVASFIGVLLLGGILAMQLLSQTNNLTNSGKAPTEDTINQTVTEAEIEMAIKEIRGHYERKLGELKEELQSEDAQQYGFVQEAKKAVEKFEQRKNYASQTELTTYMERVNEIITLRVSMPDEEFELLENAAKSGETIKNNQLFGYIDKLNMLHERFHEQWIPLYERNQHTITDITAYVNELNNGNELTGDPDYLELIKTLRKNGYYFYHEGEGYVNFKPDYTNIYNQLADSLGDDAKLYLKLESEKTRLMDGALTSSHKELGERLLEMESFVLNYPSFLKIDQIKEQYRMYIDVYLKGTNNTRIVTEDGEISNEVKANFEALLNENEYSETAKIVSRYVQKLEETQFILTDELRAEVIELPKVLKPQSEEYSTYTYLLPISDEMIVRYEEFKARGDLTLFYGLGGNTVEMSVARIYMYAVEKGDYDTAYQLSYNGTDSELPNQEQFVKEMQQATVDYQALSNDVVKVSTNYEQNGEEINQLLIKENGETIVMHMKLENGYPKVVNHQH